MLYSTIVEVANLANGIAGRAICSASLANHHSGFIPPNDRERIGSTAQLLSLSSVLSPRYHHFTWQDRERIGSTAQQLSLSSVFHPRYHHFIWQDRERIGSTAQQLSLSSVFSPRYQHLSQQDRGRIATRSPFRGHPLPIVYGKYVSSRACEPMISRLFCTTDSAQLLPTIHESSFSRSLSVLLAECVHMFTATPASTIQIIENQTNYHYSY